MGGGGVKLSLTFQYATTKLQHALEESLSQSVIIFSLKQESNKRQRQKLSTHFVLRKFSSFLTTFELVVTGAVVYGAGVRIALSEFSKTEQKIAL